jgi:hypothetical protein
MRQGALEKKLDERNRKVNRRTIRVENTTPDKNRPISLTKVGTEDGIFDM